MFIHAFICPVHQMNRRMFLSVVSVAFVHVSLASTSVQAAELRVAVFNVDATPPLGSPVAYVPARKIEDPLSARGIVLTGAGKPIVLCAVDWIGIGNGGQDVWREKLSEAAGTTTDRVAVHTLHQHDAPRCDFSSELLLASHGASGIHYDVVFARETIHKVAAAIRNALSNTQPVTHLGVGQAKVEKIASNRRILGADGTVVLRRASSTRNPEAIAAPEGVIDPTLRMISFWNGQQPIACLSYYATHPQSYYGRGDVTADFVGLARAQREAELDGLPHIHFTGAAGNVAAGKYNDGSPEMRVTLTKRMADAMGRAWEATEKVSITADEVDWRTVPVRLPVSAHLDEASLSKTLSDRAATQQQRRLAACSLAFLKRAENGAPIELSCLQLKHVYVLQLPGEPFVEYQLMAQQYRQNAVVCVAGYGDYGPGYIGTKIAYSQGSYETSPCISNVSPEVEQVLTTAIRQLLK